MANKIQGLEGPRVVSNCRDFMSDLSTDIKNWVQVARDFWLARAIKLENGAKPEDIESTESFIGFVFPSEMKELYNTVNGFENWDWTPGMISIWPLERIRDEYKTGDDRNFVGFCDFLINSHCIGFLKDQPGIYKRYDGRFPIEYVGETFKEVIGLINSDSDKIW